MYELSEFIHNSSVKIGYRVSSGHQVPTTWIDSQRKLVLVMRVLVRSRITFCKAFLSVQHVCFATISIYAVEIYSFVKWHSNTSAATACLHISPNAASISIQLGKNGVIVCQHVFQPQLLARQRQFRIPLPYSPEVVQLQAPLVFITQRRAIYNCCT